MKMLIFEVNEFKNHRPHFNALLNMNHFHQLFLTRPPQPDFYDASKNWYSEFLDFRSSADFG